MNCRQIWASSLCEESDCFRLAGHSGKCGWIALPPPSESGYLPRYAERIPPPPWKGSDAEAS